MHQAYQSVYFPWQPPASSHDPCSTIVLTKDLHTAILLPVTLGCNVNLESCAVTVQHNLYNAYAVCGRYVMAIQ
jgi:hypothetical protein